VIGLLEARARFTEGVPEVYARVGQDAEGEGNGNGGEPAYFVDLGDRTGRAIAIRGQGWDVVTSDERSVIYAQRPVILVGIDDFVVRGDLRDRAVFLNMPPIPRTSRRTERTFWPEFREDYPRIFGSVLDAIAGGLRELPSVELKELPRMADYAEWGEAVGRALGWGSHTFLTTYNDNRKEATDLILDDSPVAPLLLALGRQGVAWSGTPLALYEAALKGAGKKLGPRWPKTIHTFGSELRRIAPQLRLHGVSLRFERRSGKRIVVLKADQPEVESSS
jgi:hypothetical protein